MKTKVFIDFDGTVFDTSMFKQAFFALFEKAGFERTELLKVYQLECLNYKFSLDHFAERLFEQRKFNLPMMKARLNKIFFDIPKWLYQDTEKFLERVDRGNYEVNLLTLGNLEFQKSKIEHSGLAKYFDHIYYTEVQKWVWLLDKLPKNERFILVDDRSDTIEKVRNEFPKALCLQIERLDPDVDGLSVKAVSANTTIKSFNNMLLYLD